jgi:SulP family sulfate permease
MSLVPTPLVAGLLIWLGLQFLWKWTVGNRHESNAFDMCMVLTILFVVVRYGYVAGVAIGILMACIIFSVRYARVPFIKHHVSLAERRSNVGRSPEATVVLSRLGRSVPILQLQGYLFFGTTHGLQERVTTMLADAQAVVLDFKLVNGLDSSAALGLKKMTRSAGERDVELILASLSEPCRQELLHAGVIGTGRAARDFVDLDSALEYCEDCVLATCDGLATERRRFLEWLTDELGSPEAAAEVEGATVQERFGPGDFLCREGEPTDSLMFIESGRINVVLGHPGQSRSD